MRFLRDMQMSCWRASIFIGALLGNLEGIRLLGLLRMAEGVLRMECLSLWELCEGNLEGGLPPGDPKGYLEKSLGRVSLYIGALLLGNLEEGSSTEDCES
jgi:hypothetical protein